MEGGGGGGGLGGVRMGEESGGVGGMWEGKLEAGCVCVCVCVCSEVPVCVSQREACVRERARVCVVGVWCGYVCHFASKILVKK